jgi:hypothetical protein
MIENFVALRAAYATVGVCCVVCGDVISYT